MYNTINNNSSIIRSATDADVAWVAEHMRQSDVDEQRALGNMDPPERFIRRSVELSSLVYAGIDPSDGRACCIFGIGAYPAEYRDGGWHAYWPVWLLATPSLMGQRRLFIEQSRRFFGACMSGWSGRTLGNWVWCRNEASIRWLEGFGFKDKGTVRVTETGERFLLLVRTGEERGY